MKQSRARAETIDGVRQFNRFYTRKIGVLDEGMLASEFSLTEARVLYELARRPGSIATQLERDLELDRGYLSRILTRFAGRRMIKRVRSEEDGRQLALFLTPQGERIFADLNARSSRQVRGFVGHLTSGDQERLVGHLNSVRHLLAGPATAADGIRLREPRPGDLGWVVQRHGALYAQEYGWDAEFEGLVAQIVAEYVQKRDLRRDRCWIAEMEGEPVGCVFLVHQTDAVAKLRLLLVEPSARGHGVGRRLVEECVAFARGAGYRRIGLWTNSVLVAARRIYEKAGFKLVRSEPHTSFGHRLVGETWELDLSAPA